MLFKYLDNMSDEMTIHANHKEIPMTDQELVDAFLDGDLPPAEMSHTSHVRIAWADLKRHSLEVAIQRQVDGLRRFTELHDAQAKFHTTITWAFVLLVHDRMQRGPADATWDDFAAANPDLLTYHPSPLEAYYKEETLRSDLARRAFVLPDRLAGVLS